MTTEEERGTCSQCQRTEQKDCILFTIGGAGNPVFVCPDCVRGKKTGDWKNPWGNDCYSLSQSESESEDEVAVPTFTEGQVRKFPNPLLNGMREKDVDGGWWIAHDNTWFPYGDEGSVSVNESGCECGEDDCDKEHVCECCQQETDYDDLYKCDDCFNLYCEECGTGKGGQCKECESDSEDDE